jgi:Carboxypeptidase regulatory-like domain
MHRSVRYVILALFVGLVSIAAFAQNAQFSGRVTDPQGKVVAGASIRIFNQATGVERNIKTNSNGLYVAPFVQPGMYQIYVQAPGFTTLSSEPVTITIGQDLIFDAQLKVGDTAQQVVVSASDNEVDTTDGSVSTLIDREFVENLPLNGRSFQPLLLMTPGVNLNAGGGMTGEGEGTDGQFVVNGQRADSNYWMVDGVSANLGYSPGSPGSGAAGTEGSSNLLGGTSAMVSVDALQEFRIETSTYAPEFGRTMGGQIAIQTRSGTNQFHGTVFDFLRNTDLDAKDWFANYYGLKKSAEIQNDFGGVVGGPILSNKTFFFLSLEGLRLLQPYTVVATVPDLATRENAVPAMQPYLKMYPLPTSNVDSPAGSGLSPYTATISNPSTANAYSLRIDHQLMGDLNLFARYSHAPSRQTLRQAPPNQISHNEGITKTATVGATWTLSPQLVNDTRFNYSVAGGTGSFTTDSFGGGTPFPGNLFPSPFTNQTATICFCNWTGTGTSVTEGVFASQHIHQNNLVNTLSVQRGPHSLKFGADYRRLTPTFGQSPYQAEPIFLSENSLLTGVADYNVIHNYVQGTYLLQNLGVFAQDTWRANSRLSLTYGLRWDVDFQAGVIKGYPLPALTGFSLNDLSNLGLAPAGTPAYNTHYGNIAPRIGGAYRLLTDPDWGLVFRGGFGVFYGLDSTEVVNVTALDSGMYPFAGVRLLMNYPFPTSPSDPQVSLPDVVPANVENQNTLFGVDPNLNQPYSLQWNAALEQSLGKAQSVSLTYVGASDRRLLEVENINAPNPNFNSAYLEAGVGSLNYNAMQVQFRRQMTHGLQVLLSYSWSHSIDDGSYGNYYNGGLGSIRANRGDSDYDIRNAFTTAMSYQPPALNHNFFTRAITSHWSTDNIVQVRSGPPIDVRGREL